MSGKVIVIAGPTASGKTELSVQLARAIGGEIVSADSMQVYRRMDIGTAKAGPRERSAAVHHMLDVAEPWEDYSAARYVREAAACCEDILSRGKTPIITGGTGFYIDSLLSGRDFAPGERRGNELRQKISAEYDSLGGEEMLRRLREIDPERAEKLHPADRRRIVRAMEIYLLTGLSATEYDRAARAAPPRWESLRVALNYADRRRLYERIDSRADYMAAAGLFEETEALLREGLSPECTSMQAIGYKESALALSGRISRDEAMDMIKQNSRRYAKRQLTWFNRWGGALRLDWEDAPDITAALRRITAAWDELRDLAG